MPENSSVRPRLEIAKSDGKLAESVDINFAINPAKPDLMQGA
jgi:hypothetical protein